MGKKVLTISHHTSNKLTMFQHTGISHAVGMKLALPDLAYMLQGWQLRNTYGYILHTTTLTLSYYCANTNELNKL